MPANTTDIEKRLWDAADELRANSKLKASEYSAPVLGLIFLRYADQKFTAAEEALAKARPAASRRRTRPRGRPPTAPASPSQLASSPHLLVRRRGYPRTRPGEKPDVRVASRHAAVLVAGADDKEVVT